MKIKKLFAGVSVCAAMILTPLASAMGTSAEEPLSTKAYICGSIGSTAVWSADTVTDGSKVATVNGDAQYEVEWKVNDIGATSLTFLALSIPNVTSDKYPNINVKVTEVFVDGLRMDYEMSSNALNTAYYEAGRDPETRVYLYDGLKGTNVSDLPKELEIKDSVKVLFTVSGTGTYGTSNVETTDGTAVTTAAGDQTAAATTTTTITNDIYALQQTTTTVSSTDNGIKSTTTGDGGVAAVAVVGLVLTGGVAVLSKIKVRSKK